MQREVVGVAVRHLKKARVLAASKTIRGKKNALLCIRFNFNTTLLLAQSEHQQWTLRRILGQVRS